ncbi:MAG: hypothetical protein HY866_10505 [Chloroflexi bacterium]|nr:hypothetical protein [Chloroflexota bacterium]
MPKFRIWSILGALSILLTLVFAVTPTSVSAAPETLSYSAMTGTCSTTGFSMSATASQSFSGPATIDGRTTLDGVDYDTYTFTLPAGTTSFGTAFSRSWAALPSADFVFVFYSTVIIDSQQVWLARVTITCVEGGLAADFSGTDLQQPGVAVVPAAVPGCDTKMALTSTSVVGAVVSDAVLYAQPGTSISPVITLPPGKTAWVLGLDPTGEYYKLVWACDYLWVQRGTMGPNYDGVWQGRPLPTDTVN